MAHKGLAEVVIVFSNILKPKIRMKVGLANTASDLYSVFLNFCQQLVFNVRMSLQCILPFTTPGPLSGLMSLPCLQM